MEASFTRCVSERFDFTVVEVTAAVEDHSADVRALGALREELADFLRALDIRGGLFERFVERGGGDQGPASRVVDDLGVDVLIGIVNSQTWTFRGAGYFAADAVVDASADRLAIDSAHSAVIDLR